MSELFGYMPDDREVRMARLADGPFSCDVIEYGASVRSLVVPDREGRPVDVVLGFDGLDGYLGQHGEHLGAVPGRFANRIGGASFVLPAGDGGDISPGSQTFMENGEYKVRFYLDANNGPNCLHGGFRGFGTRCWTLQDESVNSATFGIFSPDGEGGFPGDMYAEVTYTLKADWGACGQGDPAGSLKGQIGSGPACRLIIEYRAKCTKDCPVSLTNHSYFNLAGHGAGPEAAMAHRLRICADSYTPVDAELIPTGETAPVEGTPLDFRVFKTIGERVDEPFEQLRFGSGYDHNFVLDPADRESPAAEAVCGTSGIGLRVYTDRPGMQLYTGNFLGVAQDGSPSPLNGKNGALYERRGAFCLETQGFPDAPNKPQFPSALLKAGDTFESRTVFEFSRKA